MNDCHGHLLPFGKHPWLDTETRIMKTTQIQATEKKPYVRPELVKHGNVESLTQSIPGYGGGCSHPLQTL